MLKPVLLLISVIYLVPTYKCANILCYFHIPLYSRQAAFRSFASELARRGHRVVMVTTQQAPAQLPPNLTEVVVSTPARANVTAILETATHSHSDYLTKRRKTLATIMTAFEQQLQTKAVQEILQNKTHFDLLIADSTAHCPALALSYVLRVPAILVRTNPPTHYEHEIVGSEKHALLYPEVLENKFSSQTPWGVAYQWFLQYGIRQSSSMAENLGNEILKRNFGPGMPPLAELKKNVFAVIVNAPWVWDHNRPVPINMVYVGDMSQPEEKELPKDIRAYLDSSVHGVIYMSLGSISDLSHLSEAKLRIFLSAFSALPYDILLKCKGDLPSAPDNVRAYKWLPQRDVLRHPKMKLFITQGGLHSTMEAITAGVPILGVPMFTDQWYNIRRCVDLKVGLEIDLENLTEEQLLNTVNAIVKNEIYAAETRRLRSRLQLRESGAERAALVAERVLRTVRGRSRRYDSCPECSLLLTVGVALLMLLILARYILKSLWAVAKKSVAKFKSC